MHSKMKTFKLVKIYEFESSCYIQAETLEQAQEYALEADEWEDGENALTKEMYKCVEASGDIDDDIDALDEEDYVVTWDINSRD